MSRNSKASGRDTRTTSVFEIVGSYFCDTFFNHVYLSARNRVAAGGSLTDEYIRLVKTYLVGVKADKKCYSDVVRGVHSYFTATTRYTTLGFAEFVDRIVGVCVPEEYFEKFSTSDKDEILGSILCDLVSNLAAHVTTPDMLRRIIDEHASAPDMTIRLMQDHAVTILSEKRLTLHNKFLSKAGQAREFVSLAQVDDMKKAMRRLVKEKAEAIARAEELEKEIRAHRREAKAREAKMLKIIHLLRTERALGPAAAVAHLRVPKEDLTAEQDPFDDVGVPDQEKIAEARGGSESSDSGDSSSDPSPGSSEGEPAPRKKAAAPPARDRDRRGVKRGQGRPAPKKAEQAPSGLADFFRSAPAAPAPPAAAQKEPSHLLASLLDGSGLLDMPDE